MFVCFFILLVSAVSLEMFKTEIFAPGCIFHWVSVIICWDTAHQQHVNWQSWSPLTKLPESIIIFETLSSNACSPSGSYLHPAPFTQTECISSKVLHLLSSLSASIKKCGMKNEFSFPRFAPKCKCTRAPWGMLFLSLLSHSHLKFYIWLRSSSAVNWTEMLSVCVCSTRFDEQSQTVTGQIISQQKRLNLVDMASCAVMAAVVWPQRDWADSAFMELTRTQRFCTLSVFCRPSPLTARLQSVYERLCSSNTAAKVIWSLGVYVATSFIGIKMLKWWSVMCWCARKTTI